MFTNYRDQKKKCQGYFCFLLSWLAIEQNVQKEGVPSFLHSFYKKRSAASCRSWSTSRNAAAQIAH